MSIIRVEKKGVEVEEEDEEVEGDEEEEVEEEEVVTFSSLFSSSFNVKPSTRMVRSPAV